LIFPYQVIILVLVSVFIAYTLFNYKRGEISFLALVFWLAIWIALIYTTFSLRLIGFIQRVFLAQGLNIIVVFSVITLFFVCYVLFIQITKIRKEITQIVRYIGLKEAKKLKPDS